MKVFYLLFFVALCCYSFSVLSKGIDTVKEMKARQEVTLNLIAGGK